MVRFLHIIHISKAKEIFSLIMVSQLCFKYSYKLVYKNRKENKNLKKIKIKKKIKNYAEVLSPSTE